MSIRTISLNGKKVKMNIEKGIGFNAIELYFREERLETLACFLNYNSEDDWMNNGYRLLKDFKSKMVTEVSLENLINKYNISNITIETAGFDLDIYRGGLTLCSAEFSIEVNNAIDRPLSDFLSVSMNDILDIVLDGGMSYSIFPSQQLNDLLETRSCEKGCEYNCNCIRIATTSLKESLIEALQSRDEEWAFYHNDVNLSRGRLSLK